MLYLPLFLNWSGGYWSFDNFLNFIKLNDANWYRYNFLWQRLMTRSLRSNNLAMKLRSCLIPPDGNLMLLTCLISRNPYINSQCCQYATLMPYHFFIITHFRPNILAGFALLCRTFSSFRILSCLFSTLLCL